MHIAMVVLWLLSVVVPFIVGGFLGLLTGVFKGGELSHAYARHLDRTCPRCTGNKAADDEQDDADEEDRLDALTARDLMRAIERILGNEDTVKALPLDTCTELHAAWVAADTRFAEWIEWSEAASETETETVLATAGEAAV